MASYPTSVKSYTTKSDGAGNKIFAAHINDLQDEVTAIEDGLLNGTAPVNSSRITAPSLQISGASTLASLVVTGNSTVGSLTTSSGVTERGRAKPMGEWSSYVGTFGASSGTWQVNSTYSLSYTAVGRTMTIAFSLQTSTLTAAAQTLTIGLPSTYTAVNLVVNACRITDGGASTTAVVFASAASTSLSIQKVSAGAISSGAILAQGSITFEV